MTVHRCLSFFVGLPDGKAALMDGGIYRTKVNDIYHYRCEECGAEWDDGNDAPPHDGLVVKGVEETEHGLTLVIDKPRRSIVPGVRLRAEGIDTALVVVSAGEHPSGYGLLIDPARVQVGAKLFVEIVPPEGAVEVK